MFEINYIIIILNRQRVQEKSFFCKISYSINHKFFAIIKVKFINDVFFL